MMNNSQGASSFFSGLSTLLGRPHPLLHNLSDTTPVQEGSGQDGSGHQADRVQGPESEGLAHVAKRGAAVADVRNTSDLQRIEEQLARSVAALELANQELGRV